jgi:hypothetical protein
MKNTTTWILVAIVAILVILVGAYVLSGNGASNPTATPTAITTPTPTMSATVATSVTPAPSVMSTATPTPTPVPTYSGSSGIAKTDFGYYITYPPFSNSDVHANLNYVVPSPSALASPQIVSYRADHIPFNAPGVEGSWNLVIVIDRICDASQLSQPLTVHVASDGTVPEGVHLQSTSVVIPAGQTYGYMDFWIDNDYYVDPVSAYYHIVPDAYCTPGTYGNTELQISYPEYFT